MISVDTITSSSTFNWNKVDLKRAQLLRYMLPPFLTIFGEVMTLIFVLKIYKVHICHKSSEFVNLVKFPQVVYKMS